MADELDRWGAAETPAEDEEVTVESVTAPEAEPPPPAVRSERGGDPGGGGKSSGVDGVDGGGEAAARTPPLRPSAVSPSPRPPKVPRWSDSFSYLSGTSRLSTMSERRLTELVEPCAQLLMLFVAWAEATQAASAAASAAAIAGAASAATGAAGSSRDHGRTARLLTYPPPPFGVLLPRVVAVLLAASVRLGGADGVGAAAGGNGGISSGLWTEDRLKAAFYTATQRIKVVRCRRR